MSSNDKDEGFGTKSVKNREVKGPVNPVATPIYATSTFKLTSANHGAALSERKEIDGLSPWLYSRWGNPTANAAADAINDLEGGYGTLVTSSGMSAVVVALLSQLQSGDHVVAPVPVYGGTDEIFRDVLPKYGINVSFVNGTKADEYSNAIQPNTKIIYCESPANPTMSITDIQAIADIAQNKSIISMIDSTFASPYNQNPIKMGIDVVIHSATKYLGGHSDIIAGSITSRTESLFLKTRQTLKLFGSILSPFDSYLLTRGIKTLEVRMQRHNENAMNVAKYLEENSKVKTVFYPGLPSHPQYEIAKKQMRGFGGMVAFEVKGSIDDAKTLIEKLNTIILAVSLGGVESLVEHAASMTHTMVPREERLKGGITDGLIRLSVGLENIEDLIKDLNQAFSYI